MNKSDEVLIKIQSEWGENWDMVVDLFGAEIAQEMEDAIAVISPEVKERMLGYIDWFEQRGHQVTEEYKKDLIKTQPTLLFSFS